MNKGGERMLQSNIEGMLFEIFAADILLGEFEILKLSDWFNVYLSHASFCVSFFKDGLKLEIFKNGVFVSHREIGSMDILREELIRLRAENDNARVK